MGRVLRTELPDGYFHAYSRGTGPMVIYRDEDDYKTFVRMLRLVAVRFSWRLQLYCLMPTHYHLVLEAPTEQLSSGMHRLNGGYAKYFNQRHGRTGALFQGRFHTRAIEDDEHMERLGSYIPDNPVRAGHCQLREEWPWTWSSFASPG